MLRQKTLSLLVFSLIGISAWCQTLRIQAPQHCEVGQRIRVSYVLNTQDVDDIKVEDFPGFEVLYGPSTSSQSSFSMVNGKTTQSSSMTFTYTLLAQKEGTFKLPAATVISNGKSIRSQTATIQVYPASNPSQGGGASAQGSQPNNSQHQQSSQRGVSNSDIFITVSANKTQVYEQEAVLLTYKLYTLVNVRQLSGEMPELDGFHCQELDSKAQMTLKHERRDGRNYGTAVWRQYVLFPQKSGKLVIPSVSFDAEVEVINKSADPFDIFFSGGSLAQLVRKTIKTPELVLNVSPLPEPRPVNFSGAVGQFSISASLTPEQVNANDAASLRMVVSGHGNMKLMKAPKVEFPKDFEVYTPKQNDKTSITSSGAKGNVIYDYVIVPRHGGKFDIDPVEFTYFDPDAKQYKTLKTDPFAISVAKGKGGSRMTAPDKEDLKVLSNDIHYIKQTEADIVPHADNYFATWRYFGNLLALSAVFALVLAVFRRQAKANADIARRRTKRASKAATKRLKQASKLLKSKDSNAFYDETLRALMGYAADKLNLPVAELNKDNVAAGLTQRGVDEASVQQYMAVLSDCEFARFAPGDPASNMEKIFESAQAAISRIENCKL